MLLFVCLLKITKAKSIKLKISFNMHSDLIHHMIKFQTIFYILHPIIQHFTTRTFQSQSNLISFLNITSIHQILILFLTPATSLSSSQSSPKDHSHLLLLFQPQQQQHGLTTVQRMMHHQVSLKRHEHRHKLD